MVKDLKLEPHDYAILAAALHIAGRTNGHATPGLGLPKDLEEFEKKNAAYYILSRMGLPVEPQEAYDALKPAAVRLAEAPKTLIHHGHTYVRKD